MMWCFQETYGTAESPKSAAEARLETIVLWFYCLTDDLVGYLREDQPVPLVPLAHFTVLLQTLDGIWFMSGWAAHVLRGVSDMLGPPWYEWLRWPTLHVEQRALPGNHCTSNALGAELALEPQSSCMGGLRKA